MFKKRVNERKIVRQAKDAAQKELLVSIYSLLYITPHKNKKAREFIHDFICILKKEIKKKEEMKERQKRLQMEKMVRCYA